MKRKKVVKALEFSFFLLGVIGVTLISCQVMIGWVVALGATTVGMVWAKLSGNNWLFLQNIVYTVINIWGVYFNLMG